MILALVEHTAIDKKNYSVKTYVEGEELCTRFVANRINYNGKDPLKTGYFYFKEMLLI